MRWIALGLLLMAEVAWGAVADPTPGHWATEPCRELNNRTCDLASHYMNSSNVVGVIFQLEWKDLEGSSDDAWTNWDRLTTAVNAVKAAGKSYGFQFFWTTFADYSSCVSSPFTTDCNGQSQLPTFITSLSSCGDYGGDKTNYPSIPCGTMIFNTNGNITIRKWEAGIQREVQELWAKVYAEYGSDPAFEVLMIAETTASNGQPSGWTATNWVDGLINLGQTARTEMPDHAIYYMTNFIVDEARFNNDPTAFMQYMVDNHDVWVSWPDTPTCDNPATQLPINQNWARDTYGGTSKLFPQNQALNFRDNEIGCLTEPKEQAIYDHIAANVDPWAVAYTLEFFDSQWTEITVADFYSQVIDDPNDSWPAAGVQVPAGVARTTLSSASTRLVHQVAWVQAPYSTHVGGATLSTGFCANDTELTNTNATYTITAENADGGEFEYFPQCGFKYTAGASSTSASFTYRLNDYDGAGNDVSYTVTVTVQ